MTPLPIMMASCERRLITVAAATVAAAAVATAAVACNRAVGSW